MRLRESSQRGLVLFRGVAHIAPASVASLFRCHIRPRRVREGRTNDASLSAEGYRSGSVVNTHIFSG